MNKLTPMMQQYMELKNQYPDSILLFRLGDFYETFFDDAKVTARDLELVLTGKDCGLSERAPMCGVPYHAIDNYVARLIDKGHKVAICDQLENPSEAKGIVKRGVTRVITPGTVVEESMLNGQDNNYIASVYMPDTENIGLSFSDISTGEFRIISCPDSSYLLSELTRIQPKEVIIPDSQASAFLKLIQRTPLRFIYTTPYYDWMFEFDAAEKALSNQFKSSGFNNYRSNEKAGSVCAGGALLQYLHTTQMNALIHLNKLSENKETNEMLLDYSTCRNLELTQTMTSGKRKGSLLWLLDKTKTAMGARELKRLILHPFTDKSVIEKRLDAETILTQNIDLREDLADALGAVYDLERLTARIAYERINAKDCLSLKNSLKALPVINNILKDVNDPLLKELSDRIDQMEDVCELLEKSIDEGAQQSLTEGAIIKRGFNKSLDSLIDLSENGKQRLIDLENKERAETGIKNLKIRYNKVFGYYIEVTKSNLNAVPYRYMRKQTLTNAERYITKELKELEDNILGAQARRNQLEYDIFIQIRNKINDNIQKIQQNAKAIAELDVLQSLANVAYENDYIRPKLNSDNLINLKDSRHPVLEKLIKDSFVPNDVYLNANEQNLLLITGPNMAGKSTFMRQTALIVLMAHIGSFVPASSADICVVDQIFTRVGASDDLASGRSTFMVEMNELAYILKNATSQSLLLLDEIGRGTSTIDGISIAIAVIEYIINQIGANTMFSTHYHELINLDKKYTKIKNCSVAAKEIGNEIIFLHKIVTGGTDKSFGIEVAKLAGLPQSVIDAAKENLKHINSQNYYAISEPGEKTQSAESANPLSQVFENINIDTMTPIEALMTLSNLKNEYCGKNDAK